MKKLPQRTKNHNLEEESFRYLQSCLPKTWTIDKPPHDYGVDARISIFDNGFATPYEILIQLKSSEKAMDKDHEKVRLHTSTYNHLIGQLHVAMLIKYVSEDKDAYYILMIDLPEPNQAQETFTIEIDKKSKLSEIIWEEIEQYIRDIVDYKMSQADVIRKRRKAQKKDF